MYYSKNSYSLLITLTLTFLIIGCNVQDKRPNILFAILDDASYSHFGAYGCNWVNSPNFDRVADQGILFAKAYTPNAKCAPSRSSILTGRNSWQLEEAANHWPYFPKKFKTYPEVLSENGYYVGYTGKGWAPGIAGEINGVERQLIGTSYNNRKLESPTSGISSNDYTANFIEFLDSKIQDDPFMFWFGSFEPHRRYEFGSGIKKGNKKISEISEVYSFWPKNDTVITDLLDYAYEIEYFDHQLGLMLDELERRDLIDNTIIIVTSDNGMPFPRIKGQEYELSNHMPLAVMWPKGIKNPGRKIDDFVSFIDFAPTILELANIELEDSGMQPIEGKSLANHLFSEEEGIIDESRDHVLIGKERHDVGRPNDLGYPIRGIVKGDYLLIQNFDTTRWPAGDPVTGYLNCDGSPTKTICLKSRANIESKKYWEWSFGKRAGLELYNISKDPECMFNLAENTDMQSILTQLKDQLYAELEEQSDPRILGNGYIFDQYEYADKTGVNFYNRFMNGEKLNSGWVNPTDFEKALK
jgi:arylsulfatase A-like enzyme